MKKILFMTLYVLAFFIQARAQTKKITGFVTDEKGNSLQGATIHAGKYDAVSGTDGSFSLTTPENNKTITVSHVGYVIATVEVGQGPVRVQLVPEEQILNDVVVVGYGTQRKDLLIGSVAQLKGEDLSKRTSPQLLQSIAGQLPGVAVIQRSGQPGNIGATIQIRGVSSFGAGTDPLIIIDGVPFSSMNNIDPNDIEAFSVLKDASSAAIYGARAASGVILITTKTGKSGKFRFQYNGYVGIQKPTTLPSYVNSAEYAALINEAQPGSYSTVQIQKFRDGSDPDNYPNTNWFNAVLKDHAVQTGHNLTISNGSERSQSLLSLGYLNQDGIIAKNNLQRYNVRFNLVNNLSKSLKLTTRLAAIQSYDKEPSTPNALDYSTTQEIIGQVVRYAPIYAIHTSNGYGIGINNTGTPASALESASFYQDNVTNLESNIKLEWTIIKGLKFTALASYSQINERTNLFRATQQLTPAITDQPSGLTNGFNNSNYKTLQTYAEYNRQLNKHEFTLMAGHSYESSYVETNTSARTNLPSNDITVINVGDASTQTNSGSAAEWSIESYFGRLQYNYDRKYLVEGVLRRDGSSRFPTSQKYGTFPSVAVGWRLSQEPFLKSRFSWLDELKLKASYGTLGNQNIGNYPYQSVLNTGHNYSFGNTITTGVALETLTDNTLHWESTRTKDAGVEVSLWKQLISFSATYFDRYTYDILVSPSSSVSSVLGFAVGVQNSGKLSNKGWEFTLNHHYTTGDFSYNAGVNFSIIQNKVMDLGVGNIRQPNGLVGNGSTLFVGHPMNVYYGYVANKLYADSSDVKSYTAAINQSAVNPNPQPGDVRYKDINGPGGKPDGKTDATYDRTILGSTIPKYTYGFNLGGRYKNFDLSVLFQGVGGVSGYLDNYAGWAFYNTASIQRWQADNHWSPANPNPNAAYPRLQLITNTGTPNTPTSSFWVINGAYVRLKNLQAGYTMPASVTRLLHIESLRLNLSAENLYTWSHYRKGWDPEVNSSGAYYPILANYSFGVNVIF
jgi:TonB-linked SusC/RagA family outer membrane protein